LSWSPASKPTPYPVLNIKNIHCSRSLPARLVWGNLNFDQAASFLHVWFGGARIRWQGRRQRLAHGASTCRLHYVHFLSITSTCTCTCALRDNPRRRQGLPNRPTLGHKPEAPWPLIILPQSCQRFLLASHSEKLAISIRAPFFVRSVILLASHSEKLAISLLFASHSEKLAISIRAPFFERSVFYLRAFSLCAAFFYLRAILKSLQSLFARHSEKCCVLFSFWVCPMEHINCSSLHLTAIVHGGERYFVQEDLLSHEYSPPRPTVSRTNSLV